MKISQKGLDLIKEFEGFRANAYRCPANVLTIGYGHTKGVFEGQKITKEEGEEFLRQDVAWAEKAVNRLVQLPLSQGQFDALVSFTYNLGAGALQKSTLLKKLNNDDPDADAEFMKFIYAGGKKLDGLIRRRQKERALFNSVDASSSEEFKPVIMDLTKDDPTS